MAVRSRFARSWSGDASRLTSALGHAGRTSTIRKTWVNGGYCQHLVEHAATLGIDMHTVSRDPTTGDRTTTALAARHTTGRPTTAPFGCDGSSIAHCSPVRSRPRQARRPDLLRAQKNPKIGQGKRVIWRMEHPVPMLRSVVQQELLTPLRTTPRPREARQADLRTDDRSRGRTRRGRPRPPRRRRGTAAPSWWRPYPAPSRVSTTVVDRKTVQERGWSLSPMDHIEVHRPCRGAAEAVNAEVLFELALRKRVVREADLGAEPLWGGARRRRRVGERGAV